MSRSCSQPVPFLRWGVGPAVLLACAVLVASAAAEPGPWKRHVIDNTSRGADGVRLADVNGDGLLDIATGWEEGGVIRIYVNPGPAKAAEPWPSVTVGKVKSPEDAVLVDLDGNGRMDVVSCCEGNQRTVFIHWAPSGQDRYLDPEAWTTEAIPATVGKQMWMFALPMQIDGQAGIDLVVGSKGSGASIGWLQSPESGTRDVAAWQFHPLRDAGWIMSLQAHDMDGDGDLDILASDRRGPGRGVFWLENPGPQAAAAGQPWREHAIGGHDREVMFLARGDLDQDGSPEIVAAVRNGGLTVFQATVQAANPWRSFEIALPDGVGTGKGVAIGDIDGDGRQDLVFTCENAGGGKSGVRWLSYSESIHEPVWKDHEISGPEGEKYDRVELIDLDGDGDLDVLTCEETANLGVIWYENPCLQPTK